ncbi:MAG: ParB/RepB/Spo0J family partition protein [bacterium]
MARKALGKGLSALIPEETPPEEVLTLELTQIDPNPYEPRESGEDEGMGDLIRSIKEKGLIQPIVVRRKDSRFQLICGGRRLRAAKKAGLERIPAVVKTASDSEVLELAIIENVQRENLNPMEEASGYKNLMKTFGYTQNEVAAKVGKDRSTVANMVRLLELPERIRSYIKSGKLSPGHGRALLAVRPSSARLALAERIVKRSLTVRDIEREASRRKGRRAKHKDPDILNIETELSRLLGTKVRIKTGKKRGIIEIEFYSSDGFDRILDLLREVSSP